MSGICGWATAGDKIRDGAAELARMMPEQTDSTTVCDANMLIGERVALGVDNMDSHSAVARSGHLMAAVTGVYHWDEALSPARDNAGNLAMLLLQSFREHGTNLPAYLSGSFSFVIADDKSGEVLLAVDRYCSRQLAYFTSSESIVFASNIQALRRHRLFPTELNPAAIHAYLYFHNVPLSVGIYKQVAKLQPGCYLQWNSGDAVSDTYFKSAFDTEYQNRTASWLADEINDLLLREVQALSLGCETGAFLSGGIDSSTITSKLALAQGACKSFSIGFDADNYDEMGFARVAADHFGSQHFSYYVTPQDIVKAVPVVAAANAEPFGNASAIPTYFCAQLAKEHGVQRLLGGDGGDELFGGNERYSYNKLLSAYNVLPPSIRRVLEKIILTDNASSANKFRRKADSYIRKAKMSLPDRLHVDNLLVNIGGVSQVLTDNFTAQLDERMPVDLIRFEYEKSSKDGLLNRQLALDWYFTLSCSDLPKVTNMCGAAKVEIAYPFLTNSVSDFSCHLSETSKVRGLRLRHFFKNAVRDILPEQTIKKSKHGFGLPFGVWVGEDSLLREFTFDNLHTLKRRDIVKPHFIDELIQTWHPKHPQYYGVMIWLLLMLEQFFHTHVDN